MNKVIWVLLCCTVITGLLVGLGACAAPAAKPVAPTTTAPKTLKIGVIETLTGIGSDNLKLSGQGAQLAEQYINSKGGITVNGEKYLLSLILQDNALNPQRAAAAATSLISEEKVSFITGSVATFLTLAISSVTEPAGVLYVPVYHAGRPDEYDPKTTKYKFYCSSSSIDNADAAMGGLQKLYPSAKTIMMSIIDDGSPALSGAKYKEAAAKRGLTILDIVPIPPPTMDYTATVQKLMAPNPDAVMIGNASLGMTGGQIKLLRQAGYTKPIFTAVANPLDDVIEIAGKDAVTNFFGFDVRVDMTPDATATMKDLNALALKQYPRLATIQVGGFNSVYTLTQAIEKAQSLDPKVVAATWEKMDAIDTGNGMGKMGGLETYGIRHIVYSPGSIFTVDKGTVKYAMPVNTYMP